MNKRIAVFTLAYDPYIGGAEVALAELVSRMPGLHFDIITWSFGSNLPRLEEKEHIRIVRVPGATKYHYIWNAFRYASREHRRLPYRAIWSMMAAYASFSALCFNYRFPAIPWLLTLQEGDPIRHIKRRALPVWPLFRAIFARATAVSAISRYLGDFAHDMGFAGPLYIIPNGVPYELFARAQSDESRARGSVFCKNIGVPDGSHVLFTTSRLVLKNGVDTMIDAMVHLPSSYSLVIAGEGPMAGDLLERISRYRLSGRVFLVGSQPHVTVIDLLAVSTLFVRPSRSEGMGNSFIEAMASGVPAIGTSVGGIPEFLVHEKTGFIVPVDDPIRLAEMIEKATSSPLREAIIQAGQALARSGYDWDHLAALMQTLITEKLVRLPRLLFLAPIYPPDIGGPAVVAERLFAEFSRKGYRVVVHAYTRFRKIPFGLGKVLYGVSGLFRASSFDGVYAFDAGIAGTVALAISRLKRIPYMVRIGGDIPWERYLLAHPREVLSLREFYAKGMHHDSPFFAIQSRVMHGATTVVVPTTLLSDLYREQYQISSEKMVVIANAVFQNESTIPVVTEPPRFIYAGRLVAYKRVDQLIEAFALLVQENPEATLQIVGDGPMKEGLVALCKRLDVSGRVVFHGAVSHGAVEQEILQSSVCVSVASTEFSPNFLLECISAGRSIIISKEHGLDIPVPEAMTWLTDDTRELADKMIALARSPHALHVSGRDWKNVYREHEQLFRSFL